MTSSWYGQAPANSAREGAGTRDWVLCKMGSCCGKNRGRLGSMATFGGGETTSGNGESAKVICRGTPGMEEEIGERFGWQRPEAEEKI